jgi:hypothetical protein
MTKGRSICELLLMASAVACSPVFQYTTRFAPNFSPAHHAVSVLGVYRDGQMSSETWGELGPRLSTALSGGSCEAAFGGSGLSNNEPLSSAIADFVRANGPTDELLAQLAPAALGEVIVVFVFAGRPPTPQKVSVVEDSNTGVGNLGGGRGGKFSSGRGGGLQGHRDENLLQLSASLFSVAQKQSVGIVDVKYSGESAADGVAGFVDKLRQSLPATTCRGWNWNGTVSPEPIRKLIEQ